MYVQRSFFNLLERKKNTAAGVVLCFYPLALLPFQGLRDCPVLLFRAPTPPPVGGWMTFAVTALPLTLKC